MPAAKSSSDTSSSPALAATSSASRSSRSRLAPVFAPTLSRKATTAPCPNAAARMSGVEPSTSTHSLFAIPLLGCDAGESGIPGESGATAVSLPEVGTASSAGGAVRSCCTSSSRPAPAADSSAKSRCLCVLYMVEWACTARTALPCDSGSGLPTWLMISYTALPGRRARASTWRNGVAGALLRTERGCGRRWPYVRWPPLAQWRPNHAAE
jgi:hypothetical protein